VIASSALADGGTSIANATAAPFGQQLFGNTANGGQSPHGDCGGVDYRSWWTLQVSAGDNVTIDWESSTTPTLSVFPVGTTDFNVSQQSTVVSDDLSDNHKQESRFRASQSGAMPVEFATRKDSCNIHDSDPGPYDFIATVTHAMVATLAVDHRSGHRTYFSPAVFNADGSPIGDTSQFSLDLQLKKSGTWSHIGTLSVGTFWIKWAKSVRGRRQYVRVRVSGPGYQRATSRTVSVTAR
jgi:hypothetical protein